MMGVTTEDEFAIAWEQAEASIGTECIHHSDVLFLDAICDKVNAEEEEVKDNETCNAANMKVGDGDNIEEEESEEDEKQELPPIAAPTDGCIFQPLVTDKEHVDQPINADYDSEVSQSENFTFSEDCDDNMTALKKKDGIDIQLLASILEEGATATAAISEDSDVVLVIGGTGVGKSAFIQAIAGKKLTRSFDSRIRKSSYVVEEGEMEGFEIGHGLESKTRHVRSFLRQDTSTYYIDSSGFGDTQGVETDIATSICVRDIAQRSGRLRFVVLINAFQFYSNRATELRRHLDVVAKFIGHNFNKHKLSFTFLFTHCNEAFSDVRSLIDKASSCEAILSAMRSNIQKLLFETKQCTNDQSTQDLVNFLSKSLTKRYPFCDVFDPIYSDLQGIRNNVEPGTAKKCMTKPAKIVHCSLTPTSKLRLDQEVKNRKVAIAIKLRDLELDDVIRHDVMSIQTLCSYVSSLSSQVLKDLNSDFEAALSKVQDKVFDVVNRGLILSSNKRGSNVSVVMVKSVKQCFDWIGLINDLINQSTTEQESRIYENDIISLKNQEEAHEQLMNLINEQATLVEVELMKLSEFLVGNGERPDLRYLGSRMKNLFIWASEFEDSFQTKLPNTKVMIQKTSEKLCAIEEQDSKLPLDVSHVEHLLRSAIALKLFHQSGLTKGTAAESLEQAYNRSVARAKVVIDLLPETVECVVAKSFHEVPSVVTPQNPNPDNRSVARAMVTIDLPPETVECVLSKSFNEVPSVVTPDKCCKFEPRLINTELMNIMLLTERIHITMKQEVISKLNGVNLLRAVIVIVVTEFTKHMKVCMKLVNVLDADRAKLLYICLKSLKVFIDSLPSFIVTEGQLFSCFEQFKLKLDTRIFRLSENVHYNLRELSSNGVVGSLDVQVRELRTLEALTWFESQKYFSSVQTDSVGNTNILETIRTAFGKYEDYTGTLQSSTSKTLALILDCKKDPISSIREQVLNLKDYFSQLDKLSLVTDNIASMVEKVIKVAGEQLLVWCETKSKETLPEYVVNLDFEATEKNLFVVKELQKVDPSFQAILSQYSTDNERKLKEYSECIFKVIAAKKDPEKICEVLTASLLWSEYIQLIQYLPPYDELCSIMNKDFNEYATNLDNLLKDHLDTLSIKDVEDQLQYICIASNSLDSHLTAPNKAWKLILQGAVLRRQAEVDTRFIGYIEDYDYDSIKIFLETLQEQQFDEPYRKCLDSLSTQLMKIVESVQINLYLPSSPSASQFNSASVQDALNYLEKAEMALGDFITILPPPSDGSPSWSLQGIRKRLHDNMMAALTESIELVLAASSDDDIFSALTCLEHCQLIYQVIDNKDDEERMAMAEVKVSELFTKLDSYVSDFLERLNSPNKKNFPPDTKVLQRSFSNLREGTRNAKCPSRVQEAYSNHRQKLSNGLEKLFQSLEDEWSDGQFTRSIIVLSFLGQELDRRCLRDHVESSYDIDTALDKVNAMKIEIQETFWMAPLEGVSIDAMSAKLDHQNSNWKPIWFSRDDYESNKNSASKCVEESWNEILTLVQGGDFAKFRRHFLDLDYAQRKMGMHLTVSFDLEAILLPIVRTRLTDLYSNMKRALHHGDFDQFECVLFPTLLKIVHELRECCIKAPRPTVDLLSNFVHACLNLEDKVHCLLHQHAEKALHEFFTSMKRLRYENLQFEAEKINNIGIFLVGQFELYRQTYCSDMNNAGLQKLIALIHEQFAKGRMVDIGMNLAALELKWPVSTIDVKKAFRKFSLRFHPDKNLNDEQTNNKFIKIKNANEFLESSDNIDFYHSYNFFFLTTAVHSITKYIREFTRCALKDKDYQVVVDTMEKVGDISGFAGLLKGSEDTADIINTPALQRVIANEAKQYAHALTIDIKKGYSVEDFVQLHHSFAMLEAFETAFKPYKNIVETSLTSAVLEELKDVLKQLEEETILLHGKSEIVANQTMPKFAMSLVKIGKFLDGFPRLKKQATASIYYILSNIDSMPWGVSFIFELGLILEKGEYLGNDEEKRVGRFLVGSFSQFQDVQTVVFNREVITADIADSVKNTTTKRCTESASLSDVPLDHSTLETECERYEDLFHRFFLEFVEQGYDELVAKVLNLVQEVGRCTSRDWNKTLKSKITEILAGIFATFTIVKSGNSFQRFKEFSENDVSGNESTNATSILFRPHNIQIIAILRLLGVGTSEKTLPNHIMEVRTGEGKSIILGALAIVLTLLGFTVRCVCYSEHLSERDNELFKDIFVTFGVADRVKYSKIGTMFKDKIAEKGNIRKLTTDLIKGNLSKNWLCHNNQYDDCSLTGSRDTSLMTTYSESGDISLQKDKERFSNEVPGEVSPLPLNGEEILLVDEVDVFFGPDFYGKTYNQIAKLQDQRIGELVKKIWANRSSKPSFSQVSRWPEYIRLGERFKDWHLQIETEVTKMCNDVQYFDNPVYEVDTMNTRLGYKVKDSINWYRTCGYRTAFAYLFEIESGRLKGKSAKLLTNRALSLHITCGKFSYSHIEPTAVLGVSGTLRGLSVEQRSIINDFGVDTYSFLPSVYSSNNLVFDKAGHGIIIETDTSRYLQEIANALKQAIYQDRSAMAIFEDDVRLRKFQKSSHWQQFKHANVLLSTTDKETRKYIIKKAATTKQVTIAEAAFGRGTDFFCMDSKLESNGGMLVVQTYLSTEKSEEIQIQGRTARQGKKGSYCMILLESDLKNKFGIDSELCKTHCNKDLYEFLDQSRQNMHGNELLKIKERVIKAEKQDSLSRRYLDALINADEQIATSCLNGLYKYVNTDD